MRRALIALAALVLFGSPAMAQPRVDWSKIEIKTTDLGHGLYLLGWGNGDSLVLTGPDGVLLVDTSVPEMAGKIRAAIAKLSDKPIRYIINTHAHADHFGGNEALAGGGAAIIAHQNLRDRMAKGQFIAAFNQRIPPSSPDALPTVTFADRLTLHFDGETIELIHATAAHTDSDTLVRFQRANVIHASGTLSPGTAYPFFDQSSGGSLTGSIAAEQTMLSLSDEQTRIIPDEGAPQSKDALKASHDMLARVRERVQKLIDAGMSEDQAVAAKPTKDLDGTWAPAGGFMTGDLYVRMAYRSLKGAPTTGAGGG